jgi:hypothetical protein
MVQAVLRKLELMLLWMVSRRRRRLGVGGAIHGFLD